MSDALMLQISIAFESSYRHYVLLIKPLIAFEYVPFLIQIKLKKRDRLTLVIVNDVNHQHTNINRILTNI